jgi:hypothetical protein
LEEKPIKFKDLPVGRGQAVGVWRLPIITIKPGRGRARLKGFMYIKTGSKEAFGKMKGSEELCV